MPPGIHDFGIQIWTSVDSSAVEMESKLFRCLSSSESEEIDPELQNSASDGLELAYVPGISKSFRRFQGLVRNAAQSGRRIVVEIHDRNPVKTIAIQSTAKAPFQSGSPAQ
jgi:hypothetical protein